MHAQNSTSPPAAKRSSATSPLAWVAAIVVLLACAGYFLIVPLATSALRSAEVLVGTLVVTVAQAAAEAADEAHCLACRQVEDSPAVQALLGEPLMCESFVHTRWIDPPRAGTLEFEFDVDGSRGVGTVHVVAVPTTEGLAVKSLVVDASEGAVLVVP